MLDLTRLIGADTAAALGIAAPVAPHAPLAALDAAQEAPFVLTQLPPWSEPLTAEPLPNAPLLAPAVVHEDALQEAQSSPVLAEQWLQGMLGQQQLQVRAEEEPLTFVAPSLRGSGLRESVQVPAQARAQPLTQAMPERPLVTALPTLGAVPGASELGATLPALQSATSSVELAPLAPLSAELAPSSASAPLRLSAAPAPEQTLVQQLQQAVRQSIELQVRQNMQSATIRLDPPELGSLEIFVSHESGRLSVSIQASNLDVSRLLSQTSERLRQDLVAANYLQVNVQVGSDSQQGRGQGRQTPYAQATEVLDAPFFDEPQGSERKASDVLVTV